MASRIGMNHRNEAAQQRIDTVITGLVDVLGVAIDPIPDQIRDRAYRETLRLEWTADALEQVLEALAGDVQDVEVEVFSLASVSRAQLEAFANAIGIEDPTNTDSYPEPEDLVTAIEAKLPVGLLSLTESVIELLTGESEDTQVPGGSDDSDASTPDDEGAGEGKGTTGAADVGETPSPPEPINLKGLKRPELNRIASEIGVEAPEQLPNIPSVIAAIEAKQAETAAAVGEGQQA
jgi:hypothetical protein